MTRRKRLSRPEWQRLRRTVMERDGWRCRKCGAPAFECDHVKPWRDGGSNHPDNLQALCRRCHAEKTAAENAARARPVKGRAEWRDRIRQLMDGD